MSIRGSRLASTLRRAGATVPWRARRRFLRAAIALHWSAVVLCGGAVLTSGCAQLVQRHLDVATAPASATRFVGGNHVELLTTGPRIENALLDAVAAATNSVNLETYILAADEVGTRLARALVAARERGVTVNLMYDSYGSRDLPDAFIAQLRSAGIATLEFNPLDPRDTRGAWEPNHRDHRKLLIVDGRTAILGGANIRRPPSVDGERRWRDTDVLVKGPVVTQFQDLFVASWLAESATPMAPAFYYPSLSKVGDQQVRAVGEGPDSDNIYAALTAAISKARTSVHLTTPYFVPDPRLLTAIQNASRRGVEVALMLPSDSDVPAALAAARSYYDELMAAGVTVYELQGALLHAKTAVVDHSWSTIGSANLDMRSFLFNREVNAVVLGHDFGTKMEVLFFQDVANSVRIDEGKWRMRGIRARFAELIARMFWYLW